MVSIRDQAWRALEHDELDHKYDHHVVRDDNGVGVDAGATGWGRMVSDGAEWGRLALGGVGTGLGWSGVGLG